MISKTLLVWSREAALDTVEDEPLQGLENVHMMRHTPIGIDTKIKFQDEEKFQKSTCVFSGIQSLYTKYGRGHTVSNCPQQLQ